MDEHPENGPSPEGRAGGIARFLESAGRLDNGPAELPLRCPCCGCKTLHERGMFDICSVCFWEDDGQDEYDADVVRGGPNGSLCLTEARANYRRFGACEKRFVGNVRPPRPEESPDQDA